jgi:hypothetical protein
LRADPFQPERVRALLKRQSAAAARGREIGQDLLVARLAEMSAAERAAFADRLERVVGRTPPDHARDRHHDDRPGPPDR